MDIIEKVRQKLIEKAKIIGQVRLAEETGYNQALLSLFLRGRTKGMTANSMLALFEYLKISVVFPDEYVPQSCSLDNYTFIPRIKARLGAGQSLLVDDEMKEIYAFRQDFLQSIGIFGEKGAILFGIIGDSMYPVFQPDDTVLVALQQKEIIEGKYYALRVNDTIQIKRFEILLNGGLRIHSENKELYSAQDVSAADSIDIIGRVRWLGRKL